MLHPALGKVTDFTGERSRGACAVVAVLLPLLFIPFCEVVVLTGERVGDRAGVGMPVGERTLAGCRDAALLLLTNLGPEAGGGVAGDRPL